jgi:hypothetical protein
MFQEKLAALLHILEDSAEGVRAWAHARRTVIDMRLLAEAYASLPVVETGEEHVWLLHILDEQGLIRNG